MQDTIRTNRRCGFSLIEVLVVAGILAGSISIMVPVVLKSTSAARNQTCAVRMKQVTRGILDYESVFGVLPPAGWLALEGVSRIAHRSDGVYGFLTKP